MADTVERLDTLGMWDVTLAFPEQVADAVKAADGLTVDLGDWWFNVRPSNTEPLLRLNLEAKTPEDVEAHVTELRSIIERGS